MAQLKRELKSRFDPGQFGGTPEDFELHLDAAFASAMVRAEGKIPRGASRIAFLIVFTLVLMALTAAIPEGQRPPRSFLSYVPMLGACAIGVVFSWLQKRWVLQRTEREFHRILAEAGIHPMGAPKPSAIV